MNLSESNAQDWPNLNKYKFQNEKLKLAKKKDNRVVIMGNSITELWISVNPEFFTKKKLYKQRHKWSNNPINVN
tara:strand:- start:95 stop:316 length:222 start_codon:yes stop_codon:yes gene_type:complete